jgi:NAD(P)-dependent dehydrogenase (short-subunit alcohol dehydrogenase family)
MRDAGKGGRIIKIRANAGDMCNKPNSMTPYSVAKAGLNRFTKCMAYELAEYGIRVNAIAPGYTYSNLSVSMGEELYKELIAKIPAGRFGQAIEIGARDVSCHDSSDILTGAVITIDGGYSLAV